MQRRYSHAAERLAGIMRIVVDSPTDTRTVGQWARLAAVSRGALKAWCAAAGERPKDLLDGLRLLRVQAALIKGDSDVRDLLDVVDRRTLERLVKRSGLTQLEDLRRLTPCELIEAQRLIVQPGTRGTLLRNVE